MMTNLRFVFLNGRTRVLVKRVFYPLKYPCPPGYRPLYLGEFPRAGDLTLYQADRKWRVISEPVILMVSQSHDREWLYDRWLTETVRKITP